MDSFSRFYSNLYSTAVRGAFSLVKGILWSKTEQMKVTRGVFTMTEVHQDE